MNQPEITSSTYGAASLRDTIGKSIPKADKYIWAIYILLLVISVVELYSASSREVNPANIFEPIIRHGRLLLLGALITMGLSRVKYKWFIPLTPVIGIFSVCVGFYVLFAGDIINGARRSTTLLGIPLQSSELLKLAAVMFIAFIMTRKRSENAASTSAVAWSAGAVLLCGALLFTQGLTNTLLLMATSFAMMLISGVPFKKFAVVLLVYGTFAGGYYYVKHLKEEGRSEMERVEQQHILETATTLSGEAATADRSHIQGGRWANWLGDGTPKYLKDINSANRQEMLSYIAQAHGGVSGVLPGNSRETSRLPLAFSDYIFAIVVEDWGLIGGLSLLLIYLALLLRAGAIASRCSRAFPALLVMGMAVMVVIQALMHMAIVTGVFPVSGQPLPLISKGGSSIIVTSIAFGIMLSVSRWAVQSGKDKEIKAELLELPAEMTAGNTGKL